MVACLAQGVGTRTASVSRAAGGTRALAAEGCWLRASLAWERRDSDTTLLFLQATLALNKGSLYYRLNGARMLAYDFPAWEITEAMPAAMRRHISTHWAGCALEMLEAGGTDSPELLVEMANLRLRALGDVEGAAALFRKVALLPGAPDFAARVHAELLCRLGREAEALDWLHWVLLKGENSALSGRVLEERIKALEAKRRAN